MSRLDQYSNRGNRGRDTRKRVPLSTRLAVTFGGFTVQFGALFFAFGMIFWWVFGAQSDVTSWFHFMGDLSSTAGRVVSVENTGISEGGSDSSPGTPIYRVSYEYYAGPVLFSGDCYGTGFSPEPGSVVTVEYVANDPAVSRIEGTRKSAIGFWGIFVAVFPAVGLAFMGVGLMRNARTARILKEGRLARGRLVAKEPTNTRINNRTVYRFTFEFEDESGASHQVSGRTHNTHLLEDDETERIIYDPGAPERGVLVDTLPGKPGVDANGSIQGVGVRALVLMLLPVGGVSVHAFIGYVLYLA